MSKFKLCLRKYFKEVKVHPILEEGEKVLELCKNLQVLKDLIVKELIFDNSDGRAYFKEETSEEVLKNFINLGSELLDIESVLWNCALALKHSSRRTLLTRTVQKVKTIQKSQTVQLDSLLKNLSSE